MNEHDFSEGVNIFFPQPTPNMSFQVEKLLQKFDGNFYNTFQIGMELQLTVPRKHAMSY